MAELQQRKVSIGYRRQVSDGNYGTEAAEVTLEWWVDGDQSGHDDETLAQEMLGRAHEIVHAQLRESLSAHIRRTIAPAKTVAAVPAGDEEVPF